MWQFGPTTLSSFIWTPLTNDGLGDVVSSFPRSAPASKGKKKSFWREHGSKLLKMTIEEMCITGNTFFVILSRLAWCMAGIVSKNGHVQSAFMTIVVKAPDDRQLSDGLLQ